jgi:hypothetical protein
MTATLPGLDRDEVVVKRPGAAVDAEGNPTQALTTVDTIRGTWGSPSYRDLLRATQAAQAIDAVVASVSTVPRMGDRLEVRGKAYSVVTVADARFHFRYGVRRVE